MNKNHDLTVLERVTLPTPRFFRKVRVVGAALATVGGILATAPVALPAAVATIGGYLVLAGSVAAAVSSVAVDPDADLKQPRTVTPEAVTSSGAASL